MLLDAHTHMPSPQWSATPDRYFHDVETAVAYLRATGVQAAQTNPWQGVMARTEQDLEEANRDVLRLQHDYDGFLYPGVSVHPLFPAVSTEWMARFRELGLLWVGEVLPGDLKYTDDPFLRLFEECQRRGHIVHLHNTPEIAAVAQRFPELRIVHAHVLPDQMPAVAACPNVWVDLSGSVAGLKVGGVESAYAALGADRLLFGSDFTVYDPRCFVTRIKTVISDPSEQERIFGGNLIRLLREAGSRPVA